MGWLDVLVGAVLTGFAVALVVVLVIDGGSLLDVALVALGGTAFVAYWVRTSWAWETLSDFWRRHPRE